MSEKDEALLELKKLIEGSSIYTFNSGLRVIEQALKRPEAIPEVKEKEVKMSKSISKPHREICSLCHEVNRVGFWVPNEIWKAAVHRSQQNSIICLRCFTRLADERSVPWDAEIKFFPVSWITHSEKLKQGSEDATVGHK